MDTWSKQLDRHLWSSYNSQDGTRFTPSQFKFLCTLLSRCMVSAAVSSRSSFPPTPGAQGPDGAPGGADWGPQGPLPWQMRGLFFSSLKKRSADMMHQCHDLGIRSHRNPGNVLRTSLQLVQPQARPSCSGHGVALPSGRLPHIFHPSTPPKLSLLFLQTQSIFQNAEGHWLFCSS